jgi:hypothetical protein
MDLYRPELFLVFDVESVGLYGEGFSWGGVLIDRKGNEIDRWCYWTDPRNAFGHDDDREWVNLNIPIPGFMVTCSDTKSVQRSFYKVWGELRLQRVILASDCPFPVEAGFLMDCMDLPEALNPNSPYPLIDVASVLLANGMDLLATYDRLPNELPIHDPLCDARQSARILARCLRSLDNRKAFFGALAEEGIMT